jgi:uncharacterized protein
MTKDILRYDKMVEEALRGVVREALARAAEHGLPGAHHFYLSFRTTFPGIVLPDVLRSRFPQEMTIVLEHQFWDLAVEGQSFSVTLSFNNRRERLTVPFAAVTAFTDPSVKFGLQFQEAEPPAEAAGAQGAEIARPNRALAGPRLVEPPPPEDAAKPPAEVVTLDKFRKK